MKMIFSSAPQKMLRVYRQEGGREVLRRIGLKLRERWARSRNHRNPPLLPEAAGQPTPTNSFPSAAIASVDVVICVHNALSDVQRCLESLQTCPDGRMRILLVDDGSAEETAAFLRAHAQQHHQRLIRNASALGYTFAANQGLRASSADRVVLLNSDTLVTPGWLDAMLMVMERDAHIGVVGPLSNTASWQSIPHVEESGDWKSNAIPSGLDLPSYAASLRCLLPTSHAEVGFVNGFCMLLRRETINDVGLFDEDTFGQGYGEENDFCLRAYKRGWRLAVCLQAYVFHAQSKSYSIERRLKLCKDADHLLDAKHGRALKQQQLGCTMAHPLLLFSRTASLQAESQHHTLEQLQREHAGRRLLYLLPAGHAGGGSNVVIAEATALRQAGLDVWIANLPEHRNSFRANYPELELPCCYADLSNPEILAFQTTDFDAVVATHNLSAHWLAQAMLAVTNPDLRLGYYIQDFEPYFYPEGSRGWRTAHSSYSLEAPFVRFCKTGWTASKLQQKCGIHCALIGPSVDARRFAPSPLHKPSDSSSKWSPIIVVAMIRTSCERRQPQLTAQLLHQLDQRLGSQVQLLSFGSSDAELLSLGIRIQPGFTNLGRLNPTAVAALLQQADLFVDASSFQAMGLTAMEAMASRCAVVGPREGGLPEVIGSDGTPLARCVDTSSLSDLVETCITLIQNPTEREALAQRGPEVSSYQPLLAASRMLNLLFADRQANGA